MINHDRILVSEHAERSNWRDFCVASTAPGANVNEGLSSDPEELCTSEARLHRQQQVASRSRSSALLLVLATLPMELAPTCCQESSWCTHRMLPLSLTQVTCHFPWMSCWHLQPHMLKSPLIVFAEGPACLPAFCFWTNSSTSRLCQKAGARPPT